MPRRKPVPIPPAGPIRWEPPSAPDGWERHDTLNQGTNRMQVHYERHGTYSEYISFAEAARRGLVSWQ